VSHVITILHINVYMYNDLTYVFDRFCNVSHQKMATRKGYRIGSVKHKDVCGLLKMWRDVAMGILTTEDCQEVVCMYV
jgi:hypothetical protein